MTVKIKITRANLHTDSTAGITEIRFSGSISVDPHAYPDDVTAESVGESLVSAIEEKLSKKRVRNQEQE